MKKKLLVLAAMMLCAVMALSSCSLFTRTIKFKNFVDQDYQFEIPPTPTSFKKLDFGGTCPKDGDGNDATHYYSDMVILSATNISTDARTTTTTTIYNMATDKVIWSGTDSMTEAGDERIYVSHDARSERLYVDGKYVVLAIAETETKTQTNNRVTKTVYDITVFTENGDEVFSLKDANKSRITESIFVRADLFFIQQKAYRVSKDGSAKFAFDWSDARKKPSTRLEKAGDFYVESDRMAGYVNIYDSDLNPTANYVVPVYDGKDAIEMGFCAFALANGNVLVQYDVLQDVMAEKYTYFGNGEKYNLCSLLIEAKNGKIKELDLDYRIKTIRNGFSAKENGIGEKVENMAIAYPIKDQRIDRSALAAKVLSIKNNGRIAGVLDVPVMGAALRDGFWGIGHNRWEFATVDGRILIVDETGSVIGADFDINERNTEFFVVSNRIYDWNLDIKYDLTEENGSLLYVMNHSVLFKTQNGETKLYANGGVKTVISEAESEENKRTLRTLGRGAYMIIDVTSPKTKYEIYNDLGELLGTVTDNVEVPELYKVTEDGIILLSAKTIDVTINYDYRPTNYYRLG